jgi:hypothetical protein
MENIAMEAYKLKMTIKSLEKQYDSLMSCLRVSYSQGQTIWGSYQMTQSFRPGPVDYSAIPQLKNVCLDDYRKEKVSIFKLEYIGQP